VRLSRLLGHHSPAFTLNVYVHLLDDGYGEALDLDGELRSENKVRTDPSGNGWTRPEYESVDAALEREIIDSTVLDPTAGKHF
jgi:hypothetical protein